MNIIEKKFKSGNFSEEERITIAKDIRRLGFDQETRALADTYLQEAAKALHIFPAGYEHDIFNDAIEYVRNRKS